MGQRLDRPATTTNGGVQPAGQAGTTVPTSLSTTFSSSSASSTSSSSSNTSGAVANPANGTSTASNSQNLTSRNSNSRSNHRHRRHHRSRASESDSQTAAVANGETSNNSNMSPRTRFRHEMARRGYTDNSSDLFVRLFQFPSQQGSSQTSSNSANPAIAAVSESASTTPTPSTATGSRGATGSGLSAFRFFNLGGNSSSHNTGDLDSDLSSDEDEVHWNHNLNSLAQSLPFFFGVRDFKCFVCNKQIPADDVEAHIMMCLTKPRLTYNEDVLTDDKGECIICFEELEKGQTIARLQCLCIYHKHCIDDWLTRSQSCPGHPPD